MRLLQRYILSEVAAPFLVGVLIILVMLLGDQLYYLMRLVVTKGVDLPTVTRMLLFVLPEMMVTAFPLATILAVSLGLNRLVRDSEWSSLRLAGMSLAAAVLPIHLFGLGVGLGAWVIGEHLAPAAKQQFRQLYTKVSLADPTVVIQPQQWFRPGGSDSYFYVNGIDETTGEMTNLVVFSDLASDYPTVLVARQARFEAGTFQLGQVVRHVWRPDGSLQREAETATVEIRVERFVPQAFGLASSADQMSSSQLSELIADLQEQGVIRPDQVIDLHRKLAAPVSCYVLALLCVPLNILTARRGSFFGLLVTVVLVIVYFLTLQLGISLARGGVLQSAPMLGPWLQNILFGGLAVALFHRCR